MLRVWNPTTWLFGTTWQCQRLCRRKRPRCFFGKYKVFVSRWSQKATDKGHELLAMAHAIREAKLSHRKQGKFSNWECSAYMSISCFSGLNVWHQGRNEGISRDMCVHADGNSFWKAGSLRCRRIEAEMRAFEHARATKGILQKLQNTACHIRVENPESKAQRYPESSWETPLLWPISVFLDLGQ